jgi:hypothetical protein
MEFTLNEYLSIPYRVRRPLMFGSLILWVTLTATATLLASHALLRMLFNGSRKK